jgi:putative pyruvate formate lyase activating enzyme
MSIKFSERKLGMQFDLCYEICNLCRRSCKTDRTSGKVGYCGVGADMLIGRAALHEWEEPIISGENGSGAIFFSGCSLGCVYCQNRRISKDKVGKKVSEEELSEIMLRLRDAGAHNINLVTPTHYAIGIKRAVSIAKEKGLTLPIVYNTASYDSIEALKYLENTVDVYLPDFKYYRAKTAREYSFAENYVDAAKEAIAEMVRQKPKPVIEDGLMKSGVIVRILLLPGHVAEAKLSLSYLYKTYGDSIYVSLMSQYTPSENLPAPLNRRVTAAEYGELVEYADKMGIKNCFIQEKESAKESYIPDFDGNKFII